MEDSTVKNRLKTEDLAYWYFRLNGCLCLVNFLVHHERRGHEGTDVDVMAVRFPFRRELELSGHSMEDHNVFDFVGKTDLIIAEVKRGRCDLNGPWTKRESGNMKRVLYAIGAFPEMQIDNVADALYDQRCYENRMYRMRLFALGKYRNDDLSDGVVQITWDEIARFIFERFTRYGEYKTQHRQWDDTGQRLFELANQHWQSPEEFIEIVNSRLVA